MSEKILFIGGEQDRRTLAIPKGQREVQFPIFQASRIGVTEMTPTVVGVKTESYFLEQIRSQTKTYSIYRHQSLTTDDVLTMLIENYADKK